MEIDNKHYNNLFETLYCENKSGFSMSALHTHNFYEQYDMSLGSFPNHWKPWKKSS